MRDFSDDLRDLRRRLDEASSYLKVDSNKARLSELEIEITRPDLWDDQNLAKRVNTEYANIKSDLDEFAANNVRLKIIGNYKALAPDIVDMLEESIARTSQNTRTTLAVALNYGAQDELVRAARSAAAQGEITVESIEANLDTAGLPPLDLLIRTSGEQRLSNFMLWQAAYAEFWFTDTLWPDFSKDELAQALTEFSTRERRYGGR